MEKKPFVTREQLEEIKKTYPTPFHLYDEKGIRENGERLMRAFSWNKGFREYFAVKATPNPFVIDILKKLGCGVDCSSLTELMMAKAMKLRWREDHVLLQRYTAGGVQDGCRAGRDHQP